MKNVAKLLLIPFVLLSLSVIAQEESVNADQSAENSERTDDAIPEQQPSKQEQTQEPVGNKSKPRKVFRPTEEISEDSPVPFPVDI